jgi:general secretion pathway protein D
MRIATVSLAAWLTFVSATAAAAGPPAQPGNECRRLPAGKRVVRLNLKPNSEVVDLVAWISAVTCKQFLLPAGLATGKTVTVFAPQLITPEEAYRLFVAALDSVGLTLYPSGRFLRVIEVGAAKTAPIPVIGLSPGGR